MKLRVLQSLKRTLIALITMLGLFTVSNITAQAVEAKELTEVVTLLQHLDQSDGTIAPNASGGYDLRTGQAYKLRLVFDLKKYNGDLVDGDYFTFNFPAPMSIISNTTQLIDPKTGVNIGEVVITGNGANLGGTAKVTLKNLEAYRLATGEDIIKDISGNFATTFIFRTDQNKVVINYDSASLVDPVSYTYSAVTNTGTVEGYENFAKNGGVASKKAWTSARLQAIGSPSSGEFVSSWRLRINNGAQDLGQNLLITDYIPNDPQYASIQYIPESVKVYRIPIDQQIGTGPAGGTLLTENTDYTLQWNANYTRLEITLKNGSQKYFISYDTTTPNDGSKVANYISVTKEDGTKVTQRSNNTRTDMTAAATSLYSGTIVASTAYMIKINKVDEFSMAPLQGAVFTVTAADGSVAPQEITTDSNGAALTLAYNPSMVGKTFIIKEKTAPTGYQLDPTEYRVVLGSGGSVLNLKNTPVHALVNVTARKELSGRTLQDQEFTFKLYDANGNEVGEAKNDATGAIVFSGVKLSGTGTYQYSIGEVDTQNGGVTFDLERKYVTIEVIRGADGMLKATVTSQPVVFTNSYTVSPAKVSVTAQKNLTGRDLKDREFSFELYDAAGGLVATGHNDTNGLITFPDFTLDTVGTYTFTMKEVVGTLGE